MRGCGTACAHHRRAEDAKVRGLARQAPRSMTSVSFLSHDLAALPGNRFEALKGDRKGQYSIRVNDQWRICFEWPDKPPGPTNVEIVNYH